MALCPCPVLTPVVRASISPALTARAGNKLICIDCETSLDFHRLDAVRVHCTGKRHLTRINSAFQERLKQASLSQVLEQKRKEEGKALTLTPQELAWRHNVLDRCVRGGINVFQLGQIKDLFSSKEAIFHMPGESEIRETLVPEADKVEQRRIRETIEGLAYYAIGYDGTPHVGEMFAIVLHYCKDWRVHNMLIAVAHLDKSPDAKALSKVLLSQLQSSGFVPPDLKPSDLARVQLDKIIGVSKDSVSVNRAALQLNQGIWSDKAIMNCFSHVIDRIGKRLEAPDVEHLVSSFVQLISHSAKVASVLHAPALLIFV